MGHNGALIVFCFICLLPLLMTISISLTDSDSIARYGYRLIPDRISLKAYEYVFAQPQQVITGYRNSLYITIVGTALNVFVTAMAAYPLSRADFRFRGALSVYIFVTMIFSGGLVASYILVVRYLHLKNSLMALILLPVAAPYNIFLTRILFQDISPSLIEAAELDGSGEFNTFIRIVMPLSLPSIATITLMIVLGSWNESFNAMLYIDDAGKRPMQLIGRASATRRRPAACARWTRLPSCSTSTTPTNSAISLRPAPISRRRATFRPTS